VSRPGVAPRRALAAAVLVVLVAGCWGGKQAPRAPATPPLRIEITAATDSNQGGPLVVVVRKTDRAGFLAEDYDAIADGVFAEPRDPAVLRKAIVRPGDKVTLDVPRAMAQGEIVGLYFLFAIPGDRWRLAIGDAQVSGVRVRLGTSDIQSVENAR
jgi:predicted component of type VI protein secretion system